MNMQLAKILAKLLLFLWPDVLEILATKDYNSSLSYQKREFILLSVTKLAELKTLDLGSNSGGQFSDGNIGITRIEEA
jgi:hypothetical protein